MSNQFSRGMMPMILVGVLLPGLPLPAAGQSPAFETATGPGPTPTIRV